MLSTIGRKILQHISSCDSYVSGEELSKICNVSINTIRKEIDLINHELAGKDLNFDIELVEVED